MVLSIAGFLVSLGLLLLIHNQVHRHLQGFLYLLTRNRQVALILYSILFFPGVLLHETSHWLFAKLLRVPTKGFSLIPKRTKEGMIRFGYVETAAVDPIRASLIGLAPLLTGALALILLGLDHLGARELAANLLVANWEGAIAQLRAILRTADVFIWLYLIFAIGNTMLPSKSDRAAWVSALIVVAILAAIGLALGLGDWAGPWLAAASQRAANNFSGIFLLTAVMDLLVLIPILLLETLTAKLLGQEIVYGG